VLHGCPFGHGSKKGANPPQMRCSSFPIVASKCLTAARQRQAYYPGKRARPPTPGYQLQKFARRHSALVTGLAAVFAVLMAGIVVSTWQTIRAKRAGEMALTERDRAVQAEAKT
jgi:hypothetical protein